MTSHRVDVELGDRSYSVLVGHGVINQLEDLLPKSAKRAVVITQNNIVLQPELKIPSTTVVIGDGE
ncbi:MAG: 3-dehydroquinate synthase, partial [Acidimicrobiaceae bacterium]